MRKILLFTFFLTASQAWAISQPVDKPHVRIEKERVHIVEAGDEIMTISFKYYGTHQKWRYITDANPEVDPKVLVVGQEISIPYLGETERKAAIVAKPKPVVNKTVWGSDEMIHTIEAGDEVMTISFKYYGTHQKWRLITQANPDIDPKALITGSQIIIPALDGSTPLPQARPVVIKDKEIAIAPVPTPRAALLRTPAPEKREVPKVKIEEAYAVVDLDVDSVDVSDDDIDSITDELAGPEPIRPRRMPAAKYVESPPRKMTVTPKFEYKPQPTVEDIEAKKKRERMHRSPSGSFDPWATGSFHRDDEKAREEKRKESNFRQQDEKLFEEYQKLKQKFAALERKHLQVVEQKQELEEKVYEFQYKERKMARWEEEKSVLETQVAELTERLDDNKQERAIASEKNPVYLPSMLSYSQEQVLKEKNRILAQRFWIEKNRRQGKCSIELQTPDDSAKIRMTEFVNLLNERLGSNKVFVDPTDNKVTFQLPGRTVYGVEDPKILNERKKLLVETSDLLHELPVKNIHITGFSHFSKVNLEKGGKVSGEFFSLSQAETIKDFFVESQGWSPKYFSSGTYGPNFQTPNKKKKFFNVEVTFKKNRPVTRGLASIAESDKVLRNISDEILEKLQEPKYAKVDMTRKDLSIHLGRHYLISDASWDLTPEGRHKIDVVMEMFSMVNDANFQLEWVPGALEDNNGADRKRAMYGVQKLKAYIFEKYPWAKGRLELSYGNKHNKLQAAFTSSQDRWNKRVVFKVLPTSIHLREFKEPL